MGRKGNSAANWMTLGMNSWMLGMEAAWVIQLRMLKLAAGGAAAEAEAGRMVGEKVAANIELGAKIASGRLGSGGAKSGAAVVRHYAGPVKANARRLSRSSKRRRPKA